MHKCAARVAPTTRFSVAHSKWEMSERACVFSSFSVRYFRLNKLGESRRIPVHASAIFRVHFILTGIEWFSSIFHCARVERVIDIEMYTAPINGRCSPLVLITSLFIARAQIRINIEPPNTRSEFE